MLACIPIIHELEPLCMDVYRLRGQLTKVMFVLAYSESNIDLNAYTDGKNGNRIFKWTYQNIRQRPGMSNEYADGINEQQPDALFWHLLDLFDENIDARYNACFQELWIQSGWTWSKNQF